jgi:hypothetical protein
MESSWWLLYGLTIKGVNITVQRAPQAAEL